MAAELGMPVINGSGVARQHQLARRIRWFVAATISQRRRAAIALSEGARVSSAALIGFGLDSVIEVASAAAVAWQFAGRDHETREKTALRVIAFSFFALATYVTVEAVQTLAGVAQNARHSTVGIVLATVSLALMPVLSGLQRRAGRELGSFSAVADSKQTLLCTCLSAVLLIGLVLNSLLGWWWADPIAALIIATAAVREGVQTWLAQSCCAPTLHSTRRDSTHDCDCCD